MGQTAPILAKCLHTPEKLCARAKRVPTPKELGELFPRPVYRTDASEQKMERPKRKEMEKSHFSGKAGTRTAKVQCANGVHGFAVHKTGCSPGRVHDVKVHRMKRPTFPMSLPSQDGAAGKGREGARACGTILTAGTRARRRQTPRPT